MLFICWGTLARMPSGFSAGAKARYARILVDMFECAGLRGTLIAFISAMQVFFSGLKRFIFDEVMHYDCVQA